MTQASNDYRENSTNPALFPKTFKQIKDRFLMPLKKSLIKLIICMLKLQI